MDTRAQTVDESVAPDSTASNRMQKIASLSDVTHVAGLSDLHHGQQETPVSIATATTGTIYPELSSNVINCGMSLVRTKLEEDDLTESFISELCSSLPIHAEAHRPDRTDLEGILRRGAEHVVDRWDRDPSVLDHIENGGSMFDSSDRPNDVTDLVPPWLLRMDRTYADMPIPHLKSNHFIEFQVVDEIVDETAAAEWGLEEGQVVVFLHGDYALTFYLNWHHANRRKFREQMPITDRAKMQLSKAAFHLYRDGLRQFPTNWRQYNNTELYTGFNVESDAGRHLSRVFSAAMNVGYANRLLTALCLERAITEVRPDAGPVNLLWDVGHDTIQQESIGGKEYWVHRKGAAKAVHDKPALISGSYNMDSFIGRGRPDGTELLHSYDHGCSNVINHFEEHGRLSQRDHTTKRYNLDDGTLINEVSHVDRGPIEAVVDSLTDHGVLSKVAWLRPVANIGEW